MKKITVIAVTAVAIIFAASKSRLTPIYAAPARQSAAATPAQTAQASGTTAGAQVFKKNCAACHGANRQGNPPTFPSLIGVNQRLTVAQEEAIIHQGKGLMPAFPKLQNEELVSLLQFLNSDDIAPSPAAAPGPAASVSNTHAASGTLAAGSSLFQQNCAFCHGRDAAGGESGPDLTRSKLVAADKTGEKITEVVRNGLTNGDKRMPAFKLSDSEITDLIAFIRDQTKKATTRPGGRRGVDIADLQSGNVAAGKKYFEGAGGCSSCHSPTGDLAHVATRYEGLQLEMRMLYPRGAKSTVVVTLPSGEKVDGTVAYLDEFTIGLTDKSGTYRSWPTATVKYVVSSPADAHVAQFPKYTDADIHNLMAYIQTLR